MNTTEITPFYLLVAFCAGVILTAFVAYLAYPNQGIEEDADESAKTTFDLVEFTSSPFGEGYSGYPVRITPVEANEPHMRKNPYSGKWYITWFDQSGTQHYKTIGTDEDSMISDKNAQASVARDAEQGTEP